MYLGNKKTKNFHVPHDGRKLEYPYDWSFTIEENGTILFYPKNANSDTAILSIMRLLVQDYESIESAFDLLLKTHANGIVFTNKETKDEIFEGDRPIKIFEGDYISNVTNMRTRLHLQVLLMEEYYHVLFIHGLDKCFPLDIGKESIFFIFNYQKVFFSLSKSLVE
jgi:hypothetical protein